jgi:hypothetical protein
MARSATLEACFPGLRGSSYEITSPATDDYNCIGYAAEDDQNNWWPMWDHYWPPNMPFNDSVDSFTETFCQVLGYEVCAAGDFEPGFTKLAIYAVGDSTKHMARQLDDGRWVSKLGQERDITHTLSGVEGAHYGTVMRFLKRAVRGG